MLRNKHSEYMNSFKEIKEKKMEQTVQEKIAYHYLVRVSSSHRPISNCLFSYPIFKSSLCILIFFLCCFGFITIVIPW